jgi:hypothetical protein
MAWKKIPFEKPESAVKAAANEKRAALKLRAFPTQRQT